MTYRLRNIAVAVGLALVAALLTTFYVANYKRHVRQSESTVKVYVAKRDIPQGTSGVEMIKRHMMVTSDVTERTVVPGYVSSPDQVASLLTHADDLRRRAGHAPPVRVARPAGHPLAAARHAARALASRARPTSCSRARSATATTSTWWRTSRPASCATCFAVRVRRTRTCSSSTRRRTGSDPSKVGSGNASVGDRRQRPPRGPEGLLRSPERRRLDAPAAPGRQRDRHAVRRRGQRVDPARQRQPGQRSVTSQGAEDERYNREPAHAHLLHR